MGREVVDVAAGRLDLKGDVIDVDIPRSRGAGGAEGHIPARAGPGGEGSLVEVPGGAVADVDGGDVLEGGGVVGVGHHTHLQDGMVARRRGLGPEHELKGVEGEHSGVETREDDNLVVAVGAGGGGVVPIETHGAAGGMVIGGAAARVGVVAIGGAVVQTGPAVHEGHAASRRNALEVHGVGQLGEVGAGGLNSNGTRARGVVARADGGDVHRVGGVEGEAREAIEGVGDINQGVAVEVNLPGGGCRVGPADVERGGVEVRRGQVEHRRAGDDRARKAVVAVAREPGAGGVGGAAAGREMGGGVGRRRDNPSVGGTHAHAALVRDGGVGGGHVAGGGEDYLDVAVAVEMYLPLVGIVAGGAGVGAHAEFDHEERIAEQFLFHIVGTRDKVTVASEGVNLGVVGIGVRRTERRRVAARACHRRTQTEVAVGVHRELRVVAIPEGEGEPDRLHRRGRTVTRGGEDRRGGGHVDPQRRVGTCRERVVAKRLRPTHPRQHQRREQQKTL